MNQGRLSNGFFALLSPFQNYSQQNLDSFLISFKGQVIDFRPNFCLSLLPKYGQSLSPFQT